MVIKDYLGDSIIGLPRTRSLVNFYINGQRENGIFPPILLSSRRGDGKTHLSRCIGQNLTLPDKKTIRSFVEVNGASLKNVGQFVDNVVNQYVVNQDTTLFIDEIHCADSSVLNWLLSVIQINNDDHSVASFGGTDYTFDYHRFSVIFASTNAEKLSESMRNRLTRIELENYTQNDLIKILRKNSKDIFYFGGVEKEIVETARFSPRTTVKRAKDIIQYSRQNRTTNFNQDDWQELKKILGIRELGISNKELELLQYLNETGERSLSCLASKLGIDPTTTRRDVESFLVSNNFIVIDGKRYITAKGKKLLKRINL